jgi:ubiquinone/menaquinone biosynthesis C-methylase UbiE
MRLFLPFYLKITPTINLSLIELVRVLKKTGKLGILANHKPHGVFKKIAEVIGVMAKIDFEHDLEDHLSKLFTISDNQLMYSGS